MSDELRRKCSDHFRTRLIEELLEQDDHYQRKEILKAWLEKNNNGNK